MYLGKWYKSFFLNLGANEIAILLAVSKSPLIKLEKNLSCKSFGLSIFLSKISLAV